MKICILGYSGSGKSTLAKFLSEKYKLPLLYLDTIEYQENWFKRDREERYLLYQDFLSTSQEWIIDGNYQSLDQKERLENADYIVLLLFNRFACLKRVLLRNRRYKNKTRESIAIGCNEKIDFEFLFWILFSSRTAKRKKHYKNIAEKYGNKTYIIKNQNQLDKFYASPFATYNKSDIKKKN